MSEIFKLRRIAGVGRGRARRSVTALAAVGGSQQDIKPQTPWPWLDKNPEVPSAAAADHAAAMADGAASIAAVPEAATDCSTKSTSATILDMLASHDRDDIGEKKAILDILAAPPNCDAKNTAAENRRPDVTAVVDADSTTSTTDHIKKEEKEKEDVKGNAAADSGELHSSSSKMGAGSLTGRVVADSVENTKKGEVAAADQAIEKSEEKRRMDEMDDKLNMILDGIAELKRDQVQTKSQVSNLEASLKAVQKTKVENDDDDLLAVKACILEIKNSVQAVLAQGEEVLKTKNGGGDEKLLGLLRTRDMAVKESRDVVSWSNFLILAEMKKSIDDLHGSYKAKVLSSDQLLESIGRDVSCMKASLERNTTTTTSSLEFRSTKNDDIAELKKAFADLHISYKTKVENDDDDLLAVKACILEIKRNVQTVLAQGEEVLKAKDGSEEKLLALVKSQLQHQVKREQQPPPSLMGDPSAILNNLTMSIQSLVAAQTTNQREMRDFLNTQFCAVGVALRQMMDQLSMSIKIVGANQTRTAVKLTDLLENQTAKITSSVKVWSEALNLAFQETQAVKTQLSQLASCVYNLEQASAAVFASRGGQRWSRSLVDGDRGRVENNKTGLFVDCDKNSSSPSSPETAAVEKGSSLLEEENRKLRETVASLKSANKELKECVDQISALNTDVNAAYMQLLEEGQNK